MQVSAPDGLTPDPDPRHRRFGGLERERCSSSGGRRPLRSRRSAPTVDWCGWTTTSC